MLDLQRPTKSCPCPQGSHNLVGETKTFIQWMNIYWVNTNVRNCYIISITQLASGKVNFQFWVSWLQPAVCFHFWLPKHAPWLFWFYLKTVEGFPGGAVVENLPANAGDTGSSPGLGRSHMPRSNWAREPQLLSLRVWSLCSATREATIVRGPRTAMKSGPRLLQLEKALMQKRRPNTAKNK